MLKNKVQFPAFFINRIFPPDFIHTGSEIAPAATAFTAALLSQLLEFITKYLKTSFPMKAKTNEMSLIDQHDEYLKMKKKLMMNKRKRKRRRRMSSHSSDHTESDQEDDLSDLSDLSEGSFICLMKLKIYFNCLTTNPN